MNKIYQLVDWMDGLHLRVCHQDITHDEFEKLENELIKYEMIRVSQESLIAEIRVFNENLQWIIGLELDTGKVVVLPWWYFREVSW